ncbi:hypothetical protein ACLQ2D_16410 [Streptomyces sp. DT199]|uniref:hypothetical protein n=1 Tax=Streptomyces TaxID=1883 RepID=UPI0004C609F5|nr:hypothetical protein [Streptomyces sp. NRRL S-146]
MERTPERPWLIRAFHDMIPAPRPAQRARDAGGDEEPAADGATVRPTPRHVAVVAPDPDPGGNWFDSTEHGFGGPRPRSCPAGRG